MVCYIKEVQKKEKVSFPLWKNVDLTGDNFLSVSNGFKLTKGDDYFWANFDHFLIEQYF